MSHQKKFSRRPVQRRLVNYFLQGLLYITPMGLTVFILYWLFGFVDGLLRSTLQSLFGINIPGAGLLIFICLITLLGFVGQTVIAQPVKKQINKMLKQAPLLQTIYTAIKDFVEAFLGKEKKFDYPVLVKIDRTSDMERIGFVTQTDLSELKIKDKVAVYFPQSYSFSGDLFIVPSENVTPLDISPGVALKFAVTGGVAKINEKEETEILA
jgi:uncharacterized membrane protein